jgi:hypothetical protein
MMRRRTFLFLSILTVLTAVLLADEFKFPLKSDSVRFAVETWERASRPSTR